MKPEAADPIKTALVCPLDWGIGHATRCVPVIRQLMLQGFRVVLAASGRPLEFLRGEFPDLQAVEFPGARIRYDEKRSFATAMALRMPAMLWSVVREHRKLQKLVRETGACLVVSDNRYGCRARGAISVFITHQLDIRSPGRLGLFDPVVRRISRWFINTYNECWIPDFELHKGLAGDLSHPAILPQKTYFVGTLSRFEPHPSADTGNRTDRIDLLVMLSGPEPQRTVLEEKILHQLENTRMQVAIVRGMPERVSSGVLHGRIRLFSHLDTPRLQALILRSNLVICRSGYSSIMDLAALGKRAIFIPTPGQTEQEYLAHYLMEKKIYFSMPQERFDLLYAIEMSKNFPGMLLRNDYETLRERIRRLKELTSGSGI